MADLGPYQSALEGSWVYEELHSVRNVRPAAHATPLGMWGTFLYAGVVHYVTRGREWFTLSHGGADHERLKPASEFSPIEYPKVCALWKGGGGGGSPAPDRKRRVGGKGGGGTESCRFAGGRGGGGCRNRWVAKE